MNKLIERLLNLLAFLLTSEHPVTIDEIRLTVAGYDQDSDTAFRRMFERDKDLLRSLGIPLERHPTDAWEVEFGYVIPPEQYQLPDPGLTDEERAALLLAASVVRLGGSASGADAMFKLGGAPMTSGGMELSASLGSGVEHLGLLFQGVTERREISFTYRGSERHLHPYGLVHQRGHWYLSGRAEAGTRSFRVDRMTDVVVGSKSGAFDRPQDFDVRGAVPLEPWAAGEERIDATVRFDGEIAWWARRQVGQADVRVVDEDGSLEADIAVANIEAFIGWILGFEDQAEILGPPEVRDRLVAHLQDGF